MLLISPSFEALAAPPVDSSASIGGCAEGMKAVHQKRKAEGGPASRGYEGQEPVRQGRTSLVLKSTCLSTWPPARPIVCPPGATTQPDRVIGFRLCRDDKLGSTLGAKLVTVRQRLDVFNAGARSKLDQKYGQAREAGERSVMYIGHCPERRQGSR